MLVAPIFTNAVFIFFLSLILTYIYTTSRELYPKVSYEEVAIVIPIMGLTSILFALLATFTISNLWNRYQDIRLALITQLNQLRLIYQTIKLLPDTQNIQRTIKIYANTLATTQLNALSRDKTSPYTESIHRDLVKDLLEYTDTNQPVNKDVIMHNLYTGEIGEQLLTSDINRALYFVLLLSAILTLAAFWFLNIENSSFQFYLDLIAIMIIGLALYLVYELSNPFNSDLLRTSFTSIYTDFLNELDRDLPDINVL